MEVEMKIRGLMMDPVTSMPIVILKDSGGDAVLHTHARQASLVTRKERRQRIRRHEKIDRSDDQQDNADQQRCNPHAASP